MAVLWSWMKLSTQKVTLQGPFMALQPCRRISLFLTQLATKYNPTTLLWVSWFGLNLLLEVQELSQQLLMELKLVQIMSAKHSNDCSIGIELPLLSDTPKSMLHFGHEVATSQIMSKMQYHFSHAKCSLTQLDGFESACTCSKNVDLGTPGF